MPRVTPHSISLNVTSACNLGCRYCYADRGRFEGAQTGAMSFATARRAIDTLLDGADQDAPVTIGFLGGEPLLHPALLSDVVAYATARARGRRRRVGFSLTTNGTRITPAVADLLRAHPFAVTVSLDGGRAVHDRLRVNLLGGGTFDQVVDAVTPLLAEPGRANVTARATVTRDDLDLTARLDDLAGAGFGGVGLTPVRAGFGALRDADWPRWTKAAVALGERELGALRSGGSTAFENLRTALERLHHGWAAPFPCGAGGGYASVATDGRWYACHRAIGREAYALGDDDVAVDPGRQRTFLAERHVENIEPCRSCWARYLCSGGCHQEAASRTDGACDAVRAWLEFCLDAYCVLSHERPAWFAAPSTGWRA